MTKNKLARRSAWVSLLIGAPIGILAVLAIMILPTLITGEGLFLIALLGGYGFGLIGLLLSFFIILWYAGKWAFKDLLKGKSLITVSFIYSIRVNVVIWLIFMICTIIQDYKFFEWALLIPPLFFAIICPLFTTFTIGLLICSVIKRLSKEIG